MENNHRNWIPLNFPVPGILHVWNEVDRRW